MKLHLLLLSAALLALPGHAATVSISLSSVGGPKFATSNGSLLVNGSVIRLGVFDITGGNLATLQTSNDFGLVESLFRPLGETLQDAGSVSQANNTGTQLIINGLFGAGNTLGQIANIQSTYYPTGLQPQPLYAWVFNDASPATAGEWGIFSATAGWNFPSGLGSETLATFEVNNIIRGSTTGGTTSADQLRLAVVPEPASSMLLLIGTCLLSRRRRTAL